MCCQRAQEEGQWLNWDFSVIDYDLRNGLLKANNINSFKFCLFYETVLVMNTSINLNQSFPDIFMQDMNYSIQYMTNPSYLARARKLGWHYCLSGF